MQEIEKANYRVSHFWDDQPPHRLVRVTFSCPLCGATLGLKGHTIAPDGTVKPDVLCPYCAFNESVRLRGWKHRKPKP